MYSFKDLFNYIKSYKSELIKGNIIAILATLASIPIPLLIPLLIDEVLLQKRGFLLSSIDYIFDYNHPIFYVTITLIVTLILRVTFFMLTTWQAKIFAIISKDITFKIRKRLLNHLQSVSMSEYEAVGSGAVTSKFITDINTIDNFIGASVGKFLISIFSIIGVAVVLLSLNWKLGLFILIFNPIIIYFTTNFARRVSKLKKAENSAIEIFQDSLSETLELFGQIRASNQEGSFINQNIFKAKEIRERGINFSWKSEASSKLSFTIFIAGYDLFRAITILTVLYSDLSIGQMFAIFGYLWFMMAPFQELINIQYSYANAERSLERINDIFRLKKEPNFPHLKNPFINKQNRVELKDVTFSYGDKKIIDSINLSIPAGKKVAIVGASGSGKTTLANILLGFYPISSGEIYYDGVSIREIGLDVVRENVSVVLQNPMLFNDTLRMNLTLNREFSDEKIMEVLRVAQLSDVVNELKDGLDTLIGKNGVRLSGGQRQRVAIARTILIDPNIIILDESTSALDTKTELNLLNAIDKFLEGRTTIIIAHRASAIERADIVYMLESGRVVNIK